MKDIKNFILESSQDTLEDMTNDLSEWWDSVAIHPDNYKNVQEFKDVMKEAANKKGKRLLRMALAALEDEYEYDPKKEINPHVDDIEQVISQWAKDELDEL